MCLGLTVYVSLANRVTYQLKKRRQIVTAEIKWFIDRITYYRLIEARQSGVTVRPFDVANRLQG